VQWGIGILDLKDGILGRGVADLADDEAARAATMASDRGLSVYCMSTGLFFDDVEKGEAHFRDRHIGRVGRVIEIARVLRPKVVRLLAARSGRRDEIGDGVDYVAGEYPWLFDVYGEAIDRIADAGFSVTIENEVHGCLLTNPSETSRFFGRLGRADSVMLTWDVQNMWQMGTFPTMAVYEELRPLIGYLHLKGGQSDEDDPARVLRWQSGLADASWPVAEVTAAAVADGMCDAVCLNPSHGERRAGYNYDDIVRRDLEFVRSAVPGIR
jgi:sugar phosphate isomerase/epimerase